MAALMPEEITNWWPGEGSKSGKIVFLVRWEDGTESTTTRRVDLYLPGDKIKDADDLYPYLKVLSDLRPCSYHARYPRAGTGHRSCTCSA